MWLMERLIPGDVSRGAWFYCWDGSSHLLLAVGLPRGKWSTFSIGKRLMAVFERHEFCLCGIYCMPLPSSTSLPPLGSCLFDSQALPLSDLWFTSVQAKRLIQSACPNASLLQILQCFPLQQGALHCLGYSQTISSPISPGFWLQPC